jgi:hypothetical protein
MTKPLLKSRTSDLRRRAARRGSELADLLCGQEGGGGAAPTGGAGGETRETRSVRLLCTVLCHLLRLPRALERSGARRPSRVRLASRAACHVSRAAGG